MSASLDELQGFVKTKPGRLEERVKMDGETLKSEPRDGEGYFC